MGLFSCMLQDSGLSQAFWREIKPTPDVLSSVYYQKRDFTTVQEDIAKWSPTACYVVLWGKGSMCTVFFKHSSSHACGTCFCRIENKPGILQVQMLQWVCLSSLVSNPEAKKKTKPKKEYVKKSCHIKNNFLLKRVVSVEEGEWEEVTYSSVH